MRVLECAISEFGAFRDRTFTFGDGLNIIEGGNESGKSTLLAFIKFMFYGVPRKSAGEVVPERDRILSWQGGVAGGRMTIETADGIFRIERTMRHAKSGGRDTYPETVRIVDAATGEQIHKGEEPGEVFFGVPLHVFESTAAVRQAGATQLHTAELGSSIENMLFTGDESLNTQRALAKLDGIRRTLLHKNGKGGRLYELEEERRTVRERLERARTASAALVEKQVMAEDLKKQATRLRGQLSVSEEACNTFENTALARRFDRLHELEAKTAEIDGQIETLHRQHAHNGYLPDDGYLSRLQGLKQRLYTAREDCERAVAQKERAARDVETDESMDRRLSCAELLRQQGGLDAVMEGFVTRAEAIRQLFLPGLAMILLGVLAAVVGLVGLFLPAIPALIRSGCFAVGAVFLLAGALCLVMRGKKKQAQTTLLSAYGQSPTCTEKALAGYLEGCRMLARRHIRAEDALADATRILAERERVLGVVCEDCVTTLSRMGVSADTNDTEALYTCLDEALTSFAAVAARHGQLRREAERLTANLQELRHELSGQNEAAIRAHLPADRPEGTQEDLGRLRARRDALSRSLADTEGRRSEVERQLATLEATAEDPGTLALRLESLERELADCRRRHDALVLAGEALTTAGSRVRRGVTPRLRSGAAMWMEKLTEGRYSDLGISGTMEITVDADGQTRPIAAMSGGTVDAAYLSLRLSLLEVLYGFDRPPLLLDESLCQMDDSRTRAFLAMLAGWCAAGAQCLLFTCQSREGRLCREVGFFNHITL